MAPRLEGIKIPNFTRPLQSGYCSMLRADVLKIEVPGDGDYMRRKLSMLKNTSGFFAATNRKGRSITLILRLEEGKRVFEKLVAKFDVLPEGNRPGVISKRGATTKPLAKSGRF